LVELKAIATDLLDPPGDPIPMQRAEGIQGFEDHQVEGAGKKFVLVLFHTPPVDKQQ
jgi:hypothetical protein